MKKLIVAAAGTVALMSGAAYAEGCNYGNHVAGDATKTPLVAALEESDADRLKRLQSLEEQASAELFLESPVVHN